MISGGGQRGRVMRGFERCSAACAALLLLLGLPLAAFGNADLEALMSRLAERRTGHARFTEQHYVALLDRPVTTSGELFYEAPDRLEKRTLQPRPESLRVAAGVVEVENGRMKRSLPVQRYPELGAFIESVRATLAGDLPALRRYFSIALEGSPSRWRLQLTPLDQRLARTVSQVYISGAEAELLQIEVRQADGDRSVMNIQPLP